MPPTADPNKNRDDENGTGDDELTPAQLQAINAAVTSQLKRGLEKVVTKADLESFGNSLIEKTAAKFAEQQKQQPPADNVGKQPAKGDETAGEKAMRERLEKLEKALVASQEENKQALDSARIEREQRLLDAARSEMVRLAFTDGVTINGKVLKAKPEYAELLGDHLMKGTKVVDGKVVKTIKKAPAKGMPEEDVDVTPSEAVTNFFNSKSASAYLPAPQTGGRTVETRKPQARREVTPTTPQQPPEGDDLDQLVGNAAAHLERLGIDPTRLPSQ